MFTDAQKSRRKALTAVIQVISVGLRDSLGFLKWGHKTSVSLRISATEPRTVFRRSQITCLGQSFSVGIRWF